MINIPLSKPYFTGKELKYLREAIGQGRISGDGPFTKKCTEFLCQRYGFERALLTTSCTDALEMAGILANIQPGDEVIIPSFTFPSTANAFLLRGAHIVFADSQSDNPNLDVSQIERLITKKTKAIVPVHYSGVACDMDPLMELSKQHNLFVIEDAAHSVDSYYKEKALGSIGHFATFSFHESKNISSGEGGLLVVNENALYPRAEIIREKGTNRSAFFRGEVAKYRWVDLGSSFLPSDLIAAVLYAQLEKLDAIQQKRVKIWNRYYKGLKMLGEQGYFSLPEIPSYATNNAHLFYIVCRTLQERQELAQFLKSQGILAIFHYLSLHKSPFYQDKHGNRELPHCDRFSDCLLRLPLYCDLSLKDVNYVTHKIHQFFCATPSKDPPA